jgi:hypothetical protein
MCNQHGLSLGGNHLKGKKMKAVLEFTYPEDQDKLRWALSGEKAIIALHDIQQEVRKHFKYDAEPIAVLERVRSMTDEALNECGEE